ncbi:Glyoxalase/Bleomycin resistance protein/Dioxygenase superfamily protein [Porphyromonadaceae bacterium KH3CP3RA]|nr:Glyoxalase/Bleomycin resistance protein/Dioxygenase superfamily protein [Porphyromonadaceae bacterium KH3CP3RA]
MKINDLSITFHTDKIKKCVDFYSKYFRATVAFDADWYVMIRLQSDSTTPIYLSFEDNPYKMSRSNFAGGIVLNLKVDDVDTCYEQLRQTDVRFTEEVTDHEWGDRAFSLYDPIGNLVYIYSERPLHEKYKDAVKE